jgi:hypothetical protein
MPDPQGQSALAVDTSAAPAPAETVPAPSSSSWFDSLSDGLKANPTLQNFKTKDFSAVAESLVESQKLIGGSIRLPGEKDLPADRQAKLDKIYTQLGRPTTPDGYTLQAPSADSGVPWDAARADGFKAVAHKLNLTQEQVNGLAEYDIQRVSASQVDSTQAYNECMATLHTEWGPASKQMLGLARRTASSQFDPETIALLDAAGVSNNPKFVKALANIGKSLMEEGLIVGGREGLSEDGGLNSLQAEYEKTMADGKSAYWNKQDPGHDNAVARMHSLQKALLDLSAASTPR